MSQFHRISSNIVLCTPEIPFIYSFNLLHLHIQTNITSSVVLNLQFEDSCPGSLSQFKLTTVGLTTHRTIVQTTIPAWCWLFQIFKSRANMVHTWVPYMVWHPFKWVEVGTNLTQSNHWKGRGYVQSLYKVEYIYILHIPNCLNKFPNCISNYTVALLWCEHSIMKGLILSRQKGCGYKIIMTFRML